MKANQILAFLAFAEGNNKRLPEMENVQIYKEIEVLGLIKSEKTMVSPAGDTENIWHVTPEGEKFISLLESAGDYYEAHRQVKKDAAEVIEKAKNKWNSVMENLKF